MSRATGYGSLPEPLGFTREGLLSVVRKINGKLSLGDGTVGAVAGNLDAEPAEVVFPSADTDVTIPHSLGRVPAGFLPILPSQAGSVYAPSAAGWTAKTVKLRASATGTYKILLF